MDEICYPIGYGDGGGGPVAGQFERVRRLGNITGVPKSRFSRLQDTIDRMQAQVAPEDLPIHNGELYLERHRGCQTTQAWTKKNNRECELLLRDAEFLSSMALLQGGTYDQAFSL